MEFLPTLESHEETKTINQMVYSGINIYSTDYFPSIIFVTPADS